MIRRITRREFVRATGLGAGVLVLGVPAGPAAAATPSAAVPVFEPNVFVAIHADGTVQITVSRGEMGQGVRTALPRIVADELEADLARVRLVQAVGDAKYHSQNTDGSTSVRQMYTYLREAGAMARALLEQAAAALWDLPPAECRAQAHAVTHASGKRADFAELVARAATLPLPAKVALKTPAEFRYIGKPAKGIDVPAIITGKAVYGFDASLPGMLHACAVRAPVFDARIRSVDDAAARALPGVRGCYRIPFTPHTREFRPEEGVVVVADTAWHALRARDALKVEWDLGRNADYATASYRAELRASVAEPGKPHLARGDVEAALAGEGTPVEAIYETAMLAHAPMEPPVALAWVKPDGSCEIHAPVQDPQDVRRQVADWLKIGQDKVTVHVTLLGGAFGRKSQFDFVFEAVEASRRSGAPVKLLWTREDDIRNCYFHAEAVMAMRARLGKDGMPVAWRTRAAYPSIDWMIVKDIERPLEWETGMGLTNQPWKVPNFSVESCKARIPIRIGWLRSVCNVWQAFATNAFIDEMAAVAGIDPLAYRLRLIGADDRFHAPNESDDPVLNFNGKTIDTGRYRRVLELLAERTGWGRPLPPGHFRGIASNYAFYSYVATVVEIAVDASGGLRVVSVDTALDCGTVVNPEGVQAQVEGGTIYGLGIALHGELTAAGGRVQQSNFHDYKVPRITDAPAAIRAHIVPSDAPPTGIGEPPTPVIAPALAGAMFAAKGKRLRELPLMKGWQA